MSKSYVLQAEARERVGKGAARALRREGKIPAVIYGEKQPPLAVSLSGKEIFYKIHGGGFRTTVATIELDGQKIQVLPRDYQLDPVKDVPLHVDFLRVSLKSVVHVEIPVHFLNEEICPGIKKGGMLNIVRHEIELIAPANAIPEAVEVDLAGYEIGSSIHISSVNLPEGVESAIQERDFTIATITAPTSLLSDENADPSPAEGAGKTDKG